MSQIQLFCEGGYLIKGNPGLDYTVYKHLMGGAGVTIQPIRPKNHHDEYVQGYIQNNLGSNVPLISDYQSRDRIVEGFREAGGEIDKSKRFAIIRDRDFDVAVPDTVALTRLKRPHEKRIGTFATYRTTIENYLLRPDWFWEYTDSASFQGPKPVDSLASAETLFKTAARNIAAYSAARHALGAIVRSRIPQLPSTWTLGSGKLPDRFAHTDCQSEGQAMLSRYQQQSETITVELFYAEFQYYITVFNDAFIERGDYLVWFNGKDLHAAIRQRHESFDFDKYYQFALNRFKALSIDEIATHFPDLAELRALITP